MVKMYYGNDTGKEVGGVFKNLPTPKGRKKEEVEPVSDITNEQNTQQDNNPLDPTLENPQNEDWLVKRNHGEILEKSDERGVSLEISSKNFLGENLHQNEQTPSPTFPTDLSEDKGNHLEEVGQGDLTTNNNSSVIQEDTDTDTFGNVEISKEVLQAVMGTSTSRTPTPQTPSPTSPTLPPLQPTLNPTLTLPSPSNLPSTTPTQTPTPQPLLQSKGENTPHYITAKELQKVLGIETEEQMTQYLQEMLSNPNQQGYRLKGTKVIDEVYYFNREEVERYLQTPTLTSWMDLDYEMSQLAMELVARVLFSRKDRDIIFTRLQPELFFDELYLLFDLLYSRRGVVTAIDRTYVHIVLSRNQSRLHKGKNLNLERFKDTEVDSVIAIINSTMMMYDSLQSWYLEKTQGQTPYGNIEHQNQESSDLLDIQAVIDKYLNLYKMKRSNEIIQNGSDILTSGRKEGRKLMVGVEDAMSYIKQEFGALDSQLTLEKSKGIFNVSEQWLKLSQENTVNPIFLTKFGIPTLDKVNGGIYTKQLYTITAPTKQGKSKFCFRMCYNLLKEGKSVVFWPHEGKYVKLMSELVAIHYNEMYAHRMEDYESPTYSKLYISADDVFKKSERYHDNIELVTKATIDLCTNPAYGRLIIIDTDLHIDNFEEDIKRAVEQSGAKAVFVDYIQLINYNPRVIDKVKAIAQAYQRALHIVGALDVALFSPAQMRQEVMNELAKGNRNIDLRTAAGESSEVTRAVDLNIILYSSQLMGNTRVGGGKVIEFSTVARNSEDISNFEVYTELGHCYWTEVEKDTGEL